ncbi:MAG: glycosyltransferase family 2 protein [Candidatus Omnitrophota bacterium]
MEKIPLSVVVITKNEENNIAACLESVAWADEIVVLDDFSTDKTLEIAKRYTDRIFKRKMDIEGCHRNYAYSMAKNEWVLSLDADERATPDVGSEIAAILKKGTDCNGFTIPRRNYIGAHWVRYGGWYPSAQIKLFKRDKFRFEEAEVHPRAFMDYPCGTLKNDLLHYSYKDFADFINKINKQTTLEAAKWARTDRTIGLGKSLWRAVDRFFRTYISKKGYKDGFIGFMVAFFAGLYQLMSYAKYWQLKTQIHADVCRKS